MDIPIIRVSNSLKNNLRILKKNIKERSVKYKRGSKVILEIREAASECSYKNINVLDASEKAEYFCEYIGDITDKIDKVRKMRFVSSSFKNLDEVNNWLKKANKKFRETGNKSNFEDPGKNSMDRSIEFSNILKSSSMEIESKNVFLVANRLKIACDCYLKAKMDKEILGDIEYIRGCSKAIKILQNELKTFENKISYSSEAYRFNLSSEEEKENIKKTIGIVKKPFDSKEGANKLEKHLKKYFNKTDSKKFLNIWNTFVFQLGCMERCLSIPECVQIKKQLI